MGTSHIPSTIALPSLKTPHRARLREYRRRLRWYILAADRDRRADAGARSSRRDQLPLHAQTPFTGVVRLESYEPPSDLFDSPDSSQPR